MREILTTIGELAGAALIAIGVAFISPAVALMVLGALLALFSWLASQ